MRSSRLMSLLFILQRRRSATAPELARELEVSVRTLYRDVAALAAAGVPVWTEQGVHGGIRLMEGWRTQLDGLTGEEASALFLAGAPQAASDLGLASVVASAKAKLDATLPEELRARAGRIRERFLLDAPGWFSKPEPLQALPRVAEAVWSGRKLDIVYGQQKATRRVDPLGLVLKGGTWYLVARHQRDVRSYRVGRIERAAVADATFERPTAFELGPWWAKASSEFDESLLRYPCRLRLSRSARWIFPRIVPNESIPKRLAEAGPPDEAGWVEVQLKLESEEVALSQLLALGDGVEVLSPESLREKVRETAERMAARNRSRSSSQPGKGGRAVGRRRE